jgi:SAM-dependent MidA family methyltransferase
MSPLVSILRQEIERSGPMPFARFMELALYHPEHGYYERRETTLGRAGDYFTSVSTGSLFGELLAVQFAAWLGQMAARPLFLVEAGAHDGRLAADILGWFSRKQSCLLDTLQYWIVEPSTRRQAIQQQRLNNFAGRVHWCRTLRDLECPQPSIPSPAPSSGPGVHGVLFSNELLDAMPVCRLGWDAGQRSWFEWGVGIEGRGFAWRRLPGPLGTWNDTLVEAGLERWAEVAPALPDGFTVDLCPAAVEWWRDAASALRAGRLLTLDYGLDADELLRPERASGTLRAYRRHQVSAEVLACPGEQDLTAHVNFTALRRAGEVAGLRTEGEWSQARFLTRIAALTWQAPWPLGDWTPARTRQFHTLTHPDHLGRAFRVLAQSR